MKRKSDGQRFQRPNQQLKALSQTMLVGNSVVSVIRVVNNYLVGRSVMVKYVLSTCWRCGCYVSFDFYVVCVFSMMS